MIELFSDFVQLIFFNMLFKMLMFGKINACIKNSFFDTCSRIAMRSYIHSSYVFMIYHSHLSSHILCGHIQNIN